MSEANNKVLPKAGSYIIFSPSGNISYSVSRISYRVSDISLKNVTFYDKIPMKEGVFMSENKLLDLSFEFAVAIVNLVDGVTAPISSYMTDQPARAGTSVGANIHEFAAMLQLKETLELIEKHYAAQYDETGCFAAVNKGTLFAFAIDGKEADSFTL